MELFINIIKVLLVFGSYFVLGPLVGILIRGKDRARRILLGFMAFWLVRPPGDFTWMLYSVEFYRGHSRGFEFNHLESLAIGLALAALLEKRKDFRWMPPALGIWIMWVLVSTLSVFMAINPVYALMPTVKFFKMSFIFLGVFSAIRGVADVKALMRGFAIALIVQLLVCLHTRYIAGGFRAKGWFEHQNPMAMWSYMLSMPLLGLALAKETKWRESLLYYSAVGSAGLAVILSVSRASLVFMGVGAAAVMLGSLLQGVTVRKVSSIVVGAILTVGALMMAADTLHTRFTESGDSDPENDLRKVMVDQSRAMYESSPWIGIGWNNFGLANSRPYGTEFSEILEDWQRNRGNTIYIENYERNPLTESFYWLHLAETGMLGFFCIVLFLATTYWFSLRTTLAFRKSPMGLMLFGLLVTLSLAYFHGIYERILVQTKNLSTWIMLCAMLSRFEWWRRRKVTQLPE